MNQFSQHRESWQRLRSRVNHDWLKNSFFIRLGALRNRATTVQKADEGLIDACQSALREWNKNKRQVRSLVVAYQTEESPKQLFLIPPLSNCDQDTKSWLPDYIHEHWIENHPVEKWIQDALYAWSIAEECAEKLQASLGLSQSSADRLAVLVNDFLHSVSALSEKIGQFPSRQLV